MKALIWIGYPDSTLKPSRQQNAQAGEIGFQNLSSHSITSTVFKIESIIGPEAFMESREVAPGDASHFIFSGLVVILLETRKIKNETDFEWGDFTIKFGIVIIVMGLFTVIIPV